VPVGRRPHGPSRMPLASVRVECSRLRLAPSDRASGRAPATAGGLVRQPGQVGQLQHDPFQLLEPARSQPLVAASVQRGTPSEPVPMGTPWSPSRGDGGLAVAAAEPEHLGQLLEAHAVGDTWAVAAQGMGIRSLRQGGRELGHNGSRTQDGTSDIAMVIDG